MRNDSILFFFDDSNCFFQDIADLMSIVPQDSEEPSITGGAFDDVKDTVSPFGYNRCEGVDLGAGEPEWIVTKERSR